MVDFARVPEASGGPAVRADVLIVEDDRDTWEIMSEVLQDEGYTVASAQHGAEAMKILERDGPPCVAIIDLMMPVLAGPELMERMSAHPVYRSVPIIIATAASTTSLCATCKVLKKPVQLEDLLAAVGAICKPRSREDNVVMLKDSVRMLAQKSMELVELQRYRDDMTKLLIHDLKGPLGVILGNIDYSLSGHTDADGSEALQDAEFAARRMLRLIENLLDVAKMEAVGFTRQVAPVRLANVLEPLLRTRRPMAATYQISLDVRVDSAVMVLANARQLGRVIENIVDNAFNHLKPEGRLSIAADARRDTVRVEIGNSGPPIPQRLREAVFEKGLPSGRSAIPTNLGLGLYFCRLSMETHGGRIWVEETSDLPTVFVIELPQGGT